MGWISGYEIAFPVAGGASAEENPAVVFIAQVYGTAFSVGGDCFLTAAHTIHAAGENPHLGLGCPEGGLWKFSPITDLEVVDDYDLGIIEAKLPVSRALNWNVDELPMLEPIRTVGYPYALDIQHARLQIRAFAGHVVGARTFHRFEAAPRIYELSFACPRGLSGAPILDGHHRVAGLVVGNESTEMTVFTDREVISEKTGGETRVEQIERYEALQLGIALQSASLLDLRSRILGGDLCDHLASKELV
jgi:hypothetical protein